MLQKGNINELGVQFIPSKPSIIQSSYWQQIKYHIVVGCYRYLEYILLSMFYYFDLSLSKGEGPLNNMITISTNVTGGETKTGS